MNENKNIFACIIGWIRVQFLQYKYKQINTSKSTSKYNYKYKPLFLKVISVLV